MDRPKIETNIQLAERHKLGQYGRWHRDKSTAVMVDKQLHKSQRKKLTSL
jgi:hypothetical protein